MYCIIHHIWHNNYANNAETRTLLDKNGPTVPNEKDDNIVIYMGADTYRETIEDK